jgi:hypothetical protein
MSSEQLRNSINRQKETTYDSRVESRAAVRQSGLPRSFDVALLIEAVREFSLTCSAS